MTSRIDRQKLRNSIACIDVGDGHPCSDNLAIMLCSYFDDVRPDRDPDYDEDDPDADYDDEYGWSRWTIDRADEVLDAITDAAIEALEKEIANRDGLIDQVADAIEHASCPHREGPYGLYNYAHENPNPPEKPYCIRNFRPGTETRGRVLASFADRDVAHEEYERMTRRYLAEAALKVIEGEKSK